jgi:hypothetical protein
MVSCRGIISTFPVLSGALASAVFLAVSFTVLAICLIPALRWQYGSGAAGIARAGPSVRLRALQEGPGERRTRRRSFKRSGSVGSLRREVRTYSGASPPVFMTLSLLVPGLRRWGHHTTLSRDDFYSITPPPFQGVRTGFRQ